MPILMKYAHNIIATCHFSIKKLINKLKKLIFLLNFFFKKKKEGKWVGLPKHFPFFKKKSLIFNFLIEK
jgi:hypothetical protein